MYVLSGVRDELTKVDRLADYEHLKAKVLLPAVGYARERQLITPLQQAVLTTTIKAGTVKAGDLEAAMPDLNANQRTDQIRKLVDAGLLQPTKPGARQYSIGFSHNMLLRGVVRALTDEGFIPAALAAPPA